MGVGLTGAHVALMAKRRGASFRKTLTIGRQNLFLDGSCSPLFTGAPLYMTDARVSEMVSNEYAEDMFKAMGAETVDSLDASAYEHATIIHNLNEPIGEDLKGRFSAVVDYGSLEHVFNVPVALKSCIDMVEEGGWYLYTGPCNNQMGHGFYQFSPELFFNFLSNNGFAEIHVLICLYNDPIFFKVTDPRQYGGRTELMNDEAAQLCVIAQKKRTIEKMHYPVQSDYSSALWLGANPNRTADQFSPQPVQPQTVDAAKSVKSLANKLLQATKQEFPQLTNGFENSLQYTWVDPLTY